MHMVHHLVLRAFVGPCPAGYDGLHRDNDKSNCRLSNLRWGIRPARASDSDEINPKAKLGPGEVREIRASDDTVRALAARYGVSHVTIHHIRTRKTWNHV